jgi:hypothetical protein
MIRNLLILLCAVFVIDAAYAQAKRPLTAAEMQVLLGKGLSVSSMDIEGGKHFTASVNLEPGGRLTGSMNVAGHGVIALNGTWRLQGAQVCRTLGPAQPEVVCETWLRAGNAKEVTVVVDGKEVSVNRWQ